MSNATTSQFSADVRRGLTPDSGKRLDSKWFYDTNGSELFRLICLQPEYYLTNCELEILRDQGRAISETVCQGHPINLIELGCGDGHKTLELVRHLRECGPGMRYVPIDISASALSECRLGFQKSFPDLPIQVVHGEFGLGLAQVSGVSDRRNLVLFLGSNIGNLPWHDAISFLSSVGASLNSGDFLLIGADLMKDPSILIPAYSDAAGMTARFNLNLLERINRELAGEFDTFRFRHHASFNFRLGAMESFVYPTMAQIVTVSALQTSFRFRAFEPIHMESSGKYSETELEKMAELAGFEVVEHFYDTRRYFVDSLWRRK